MVVANLITTNAKNRREYFITLSCFLVFCLFSKYEGRVLDNIGTR